MLSQNEWRKAYEYLLGKLRQVGSESSVVLDVERAASKRIKIDSQELETHGTSVLALSSASKKDLDVLKYRAPTPQEAFNSAAEVIIATLHDVPALADRSCELLERNPENIHWRPDASEVEFSAVQESFTCADISLKNSERNEIEAALGKLQQLLELGIEEDDNIK